jgi:hypothetical protein
MQYSHNRMPAHRPAMLRYIEGGADPNDFHCFPERTSFTFRDISGTIGVLTRTSPINPGGNRPVALIGRLRPRLARRLRRRETHLEARSRAIVPGLDRL